MIRKPAQRKEALRLRRLGKSVNEIASTLGVSSSTVSLWVRYIPLTQTQKLMLTKKVLDTLQAGRKKAAEVQSKIREEEKQKMREEALKQIEKLSPRDIFIAGLALYWAEGFKKDNRLGFANSDPSMVRLFLNWLKTAGVPEDSIRLRVGLNISHKDRIDLVTSYWSNITGIPIEQFQKPYFQKFKWKKYFPNPGNYYGVIRIRAMDQGKLFMKIKTWLDVLSSV